MNKRFMLDDAGELIDLNNHLFIGYGDEVCNILNELYEENQYLKSLKWDFDCINEIIIGIQQRQLLEKENKRLQAIIQEFRESETSEWHC